MPDMIPVGNTGVTPDPSKSFGMLSAILGVKRQAQELQTGAYQQSTAASEAQKAQLGAQQQQAVQNFFQTWNPLDHVAPDGTTDLDSATESDAFRNAGNAKPAILEAMLSVKSKQLQNKQALAGLNQTLINQLGTRVGSLITDPDVQNETPNGKAKLQAEVEGWGNISPDNQRIANFYLPAIKNAKPGQLEDIARSIQLQAQDASAQQAQQNPQQLAVPTGGTTQVYNVNKATGLQSGQQPVAAIENTLPPTSQPSNLARTGPATDEGALYTSINNEAKNAQTGRALAQQVADLADQVQTGKYSKYWTDQLAILRQTDPTITARQMLDKYSAQLKTQAEAGATTDASRATVEAGMPNPESMNETSLKEAARYVGGLFSMRAARAENANQFFKRNGTALGLQGVDTTFMNHADPFLYAYNDLPAGKERQDFLRAKFGNNPDQIRDFISRSNQLRHISGGQ